MYATIYLSRDRRVTIYEEGGFQCERYITYNGKNRGYSDWVLANDEDWPDLNDAITKFKEVLYKIESNLSNVDLYKHQNELIDRFGNTVIDKAESMYETDFDKEFWRDLTPDEQLEYIHRARDILNSAE